MNAWSKIYTLWIKIHTNMCYYLSNKIQSSDEGYKPVMSLGTLHLEHKNGH